MLPIESKERLEQAMSTVFARHNLGDYIITYHTNGKITAQFKHEKDRFIFNLKGFKSMYAEVLAEFRRLENEKYAAHN